MLKPGKTLAAVLVLLLWTASTAPAQQWALDMFKETDHDFGTVARGAKVEHRFTLENCYVEDAHVQSAQASCGCTTPEVPTRVLKTWDKADVVARVDTRSLSSLGQKDVTIKVVLDKPFPAVVELHIHCYIRSDVVVQPGVVQFGAVAPGAGGRQRVAVNYAGRGDWKILRVECGNPSLSAEAVETSRGRGQVNYEVNYDLVVTLAPGAPAGYLRDEIYLVTNDANPRATRVPVPVEGMVQAPVTAHPSPLYFGTVDPGKSVTRQLVVSGGARFRIVGAASADPRFQCAPATAAAALPGLPVVFCLPVIFHAGESPGKASGKILIRTDTGSAPVEVAVQADVMPPAGADGAEANPAVPIASQPTTTARPALGVGREL
ncbi:MAG: DUF1573 domain-containing protein [Thermoguttaceae bacterium]